MAVMKSRGTLSKPGYPPCLKPGSSTHAARRAASASTSKGALSKIHPQQLAATVLKALAERNGIDTADVDDIVWGTAAQVGKQGGDLGRMAALDAGYSVKSSGVTLDRFCGSGITTVNIAAASIMAGLEDLVIAGGTEMMSMPGRRSADGRPAHDGQRQPAFARTAPAVAPGRLRRRDRDLGGHSACGARRSRA